MTPAGRCDPRGVPPEPEPDVVDDVPELDLGDRAPAPPARTPPRTRRPRWEAVRRRAWPGVAWALAGALLGGLVVHVARPAAPAGGTPAVRVALGTFGARRLNRRVGDTLTLLVSSVAVNEGSGPLEVRDLRADGPGAHLTETFRGEGSIFPLELAAGQTANMPFALAADCRVGALETPRITLVVGPPGGPATEVDVAIPDLDRAWQRILTPESCATPLPAGGVTTG